MRLFARFLLVRIIHGLGELELFVHCLIIGFLPQMDETCSRSGVESKMVLRVSQNKTRTVIETEEQCN